MKLPALWEAWILQSLLHYRLIPFECFEVVFIYGWRVDSLSELHTSIVTNPPCKTSLDCSKSQNDVSVIFFWWRSPACFQFVQKFILHLILWMSFFLRMHYPVYDCCPYKFYMFYAFKTSPSMDSYLIILFSSCRFLSCWRMHLVGIPKVYFLVQKRGIQQAFCNSMLCAWLISSQMIPIFDLTSQSTL